MSGAASVHYDPLDSSDNDSDGDVATVGSRPAATRAAEQARDVPPEVREFVVRTQVAVAFRAAAARAQEAAAAGSGTTSSAGAGAPGATSGGSASARAATSRR